MFCKDQIDFEFERTAEGNINQTYYVYIKESGDLPVFIIQRISQIFKKPELIADVNNRLYDYFIDKKFGLLELPTSIKTFTNKDIFICKKGFSWRAFKYFKNSITFTYSNDKEIIYQAANRLAYFHFALSKSNFYFKNTNLSGYRDLRNYLNLFTNIVRNNELLIDLEKDSEISFCLNIIYQERNFFELLYKKLINSSFSSGIIHGDPKLSNFLYEDGTKEIISIIDLDTVHSNIYLFDIGDFLRSICNSIAEDSTNHENIYFNIDSFKVALDGYFYYGKYFLNIQDFDYIYNSIALISYELGVRFFTDFLSGNKYFKVKYESQNLDRCKVQLLFLKSLKENSKIIKQIISEYFD